MHRFAWLAGDHVEFRDPDLVRQRDLPNQNSSCASDVPDQLTASTSVSTLATR